MARVDLDKKLIDELPSSPDDPEPVDPQLRGDEILIEDGDPILVTVHGTASYGDTVVLDLNVEQTPRECACLKGKHTVTTEGDVLCAVIS